MRGMMQGIQAAELALRVERHRQNGLRLEREIREHQQREANLAAFSPQVPVNPLPMSRVGPNFGAGNVYGQTTVGPSNLNPGNTFFQPGNPVREPNPRLATGRHGRAALHRHDSA